LAEGLGPFRHFNFNKEPMLNVMKKHQSNLEEVLWEKVPEVGIRDFAYKTWKKLIERGEKYGFRNAQATVVAPTGTISYLMGTQDSTGIEPPFSLIINKDLAGGGSISITNTEVPNALTNLGYNQEQIKDIIGYVEEEVKPLTNRGTVIGAPHLSPEHYPLFDTAVGNYEGRGSIDFEGHVKMMGAVQPFVSGGISKTNNLPERATVKEHYDGFILGHKLRLKGITTFRTNSKPISAMNFGSNSVREFKRGEKEDLPFSGNSFRQEVKIDGTPFLINIGEYVDGRPGEVVIESYSGGSTLGSLLRMAGIQASTSLKRGIVLEDVVKGWIDHQFSPSGFVAVDDPKGPHPLIKQAQSPLDFVGKLMLIHYKGRVDLATEPENVNVRKLRGFENGAFRVYKKMELDDWDVEQVLKDPETGGFVKPQNNFENGAPDGNGNGKLNNSRGLPCEKCGNIMTQTSSNCYHCNNCSHKIGGCGL
jgi:ribonucleoside-diphosphate reductase alpha chain